MITALLCAIDLYCKSWIESHLRKGDKEKLGKGPVEIRRVHNKGFAMNTMEDKSWLVKIVSVVVCLVAGIWAVFIWKEEACIVKRLAATFLFAGAISNTYDRLKRGYVVDYIGIETKNKKINRITFNLADLYIFIGAVGYAFADVFGK